VSLEAFLSKNQIQKLSGVGINNLYSLITYLPYTIEEIRSLESIFSNQNQKLFWQATLKNIEQKQGNAKSYYLLDFTDNTKTIKCFYFVGGDYAKKILKLNQKYDLYLSQKNNYFTIEKIKEITEENLPNNSLTTAQNTSKNNILQVKYSQNTFLKSAFFEQLHKQLPDSIYLLDLSGLIPKNSLIPQVINLKKIHKPKTKNEFLEAKKEWTSMQVFLYISLLKYVNDNQKQSVARSSKLDLDFLKKLTSNLPFELSVSQKQTIWDILQSICN
jgi:RecG-like helicase